MTAQRIRRATAKDVVKISWFKQNDLRRDDVVKLMADQRRRIRMGELRDHERDPVRQYLDLLPKGRNAAKVLDGIRRFGVRAALDAGLPPLRLPTSSITTSFKSDILSGEHEAGDIYKMALYVAASTIGPSTTAYTATNEVANGNGYTTAGMNMAGRQVVTDGTTAILDWT